MSEAERESERRGREGRGGGEARQFLVRRDGFVNRNCIRRLLLGVIGLVLRTFFGEILIQLKTKKINQQGIDFFAVCEFRIYFVSYVGEPIAAKLSKVAFNGKTRYDL